MIIENELEGTDLLILRHLTG